MYKPLAATSCGGGGQSKVHKDFRSTYTTAIGLRGLYCAIEQPVLIGILTC